MLRNEQARLEMVEAMRHLLQLTIMLGNKQVRLTRWGLDGLYWSCRHVRKKAGEADELEAV